MNHKQHQGETLLHALLEAFAVDAEAAVTLFTDTATIDYPYASSIGGGVARLNKVDYHTHLQGILPNMQTIQFSKVRVYPLQQAGGYWAEFEGQATVPTTGKEYRQAYVVYFTVENNQFATYREY